MRTAALLLCLLASCVPALAAARARSEFSRPSSNVTLNGDAVRVSFNDGDSFQVMSGSLKGTKGRVGGFNTLESHGPVHRWAKWTAKELFEVAHQATVNARRGGWHCSSELERDGYGRILWDCPDLAQDHLAKGLAHAYSVDAKPAAPALLATQREAIEKRRGMWRKGVPDWVMTSVHSEAEGTEGGAYNRLVSTTDAHSVKWKHTTSYEECEEVCQPPEPLGELTQAPKVPSCMVYVAFKRRYGEDKATCLRE